MVAYTDFGIWLAKRIDELGIGSQSELARRIGVSHATINRWMSGGSWPRYRDVAKLALVLEVSQAEVFQAMGLLPSLDDAAMAEIVELWERADPKERKTILAVARGILRDKLSEKDHVEEDAAR